MSHQYEDFILTYSIDDLDMRQWVVFHLTKLGKTVLELEYTGQDLDSFHYQLGKVVNPDSQWIMIYSTNYQKLFESSKHLQGVLRQLNDEKRLIIMLTEDIEEPFPCEKILPVFTLSSFAATEQLLWLLAPSKEAPNREDRVPRSHLPLIVPYAVPSYISISLNIVNKKHVYVRIVERFDYYVERVIERSIECNLRIGDKLGRIEELHQLATKNQLNDPKKIVELATKLFNSIFEARLADKFIQLYSTFRSGHIRVELELDTAELPELEGLPWEFIRHPIDKIWLATNPKISFVRNYSTKKGEEIWKDLSMVRLHEIEKLRIALVVSAPKGDEFKGVKFEKVRSALQEFERQGQIVLIDTSVMQDQTTKNLIASALEQKPDILHFIGHGRLKNKKGQVAFTDVLGEGVWISADKFSEQFKGFYHTNTLILQTCESGAISAQASTIIGGLMNRYIPIILAMQYEIPNFIAADFMKAFYESLIIKKEPVDIAVQSGRRGIAVGEIDYNTRDFATPVLFMKVID